MSQRPIHKSRNLTAILVEAGVVTEQQVDDGLARQRETGRRIGETLVELGAVSEEDIGWALSRQLALTFVDVRVEALDPDLVRSFSESLLRRLQAVPLVRSADGLSVALADPTDAEAIEELERAAGCRVALGVSTASMIRHALDSIFGVDREARSVERATTGQFDVLWDRSGAGFLLFHLTSALKQGATEIHFVPEDGQIRILYRMAGKLAPVSCEPAEVGHYLLARIDALGGPRFDRGEVHAQGWATCAVGADEVHFDVSLVRTTDGTAVTLFPRSRMTESPRLEDLGVPGSEAALLRGLVEQSAGVLLVSGPRRSGGSTLLSALLGCIDTESRRGLVFESRASAPLRGVSRVHLEPDTARSTWDEIAAGHGADVVVLDDVLTGEHVAEVLLPGAAGRLLIARTDWTDSWALLEFLLGRPRARGTAASRLLGIVQHRLIPTEAGGDAVAGLRPGYRGVFEVLAVGEALRRAMRSGAAVADLAKLLESEGFRSLETELGGLNDAGNASDDVRAAR